MNKVYELKCANCDETIEQGGYYYPLDGSRYCEKKDCMLALYNKIGLERLDDAPNEPQKGYLYYEPDRPIEKLIVRFPGGSTIESVGKWVGYEITEDGRGRYRITLTFFGHELYSTHKGILDPGMTVKTEKVNNAPNEP